MIYVPFSVNYERQALTLGRWMGWWEIARRGRSMHIGNGMVQNPKRCSDYVQPRSQTMRECRQRYHYRLMPA